MNNYKNTETQNLIIKNGKSVWKINERLVKYPRKEKNKDWRKKSKPRCKKFWKKENSYATKKVQKRFKMKMKENLYNESYYYPIPKDYHTYGWISW